MNFQKKNNEKKKWNSILIIIKTKKTIKKKKNEELVLDWHYHYIDKKIEIEQEVEKNLGFIQSI